MASITDAARGHGFIAQGSLSADGLGTWVNAATGASVYGKYDPLTGVVKTYDASTAQPTGQFIDPTGKSGADNFVGGRSAGTVLKDAGLLFGGTLGAGLALSALGGAGAAAGAGSDAAATGGSAGAGLGGGVAGGITAPGASGITAGAGTAAGAAGATAAAASPYAKLITSGLISAGTGLAKGLIQSNATSKAVQAETQAALPYSIGGNAAWQQQLAKYGITLPASATGGVGPNGMPTGAAAPTGAPMGPSAPAQGQPAPVLTTAPTLPQGYTLASLMAPQNPNLPPPTTSAFGGR